MCCALLGDGSSSQKGMGNILGRDRGICRNIQRALHARCGRRQPRPENWFRVRRSGPYLVHLLGLFCPGACGGFWLGLLTHDQGRSLEEVDELFEANLWAWKFKEFKTSGIGARLTQLEAHAIAMDELARQKLGVEHQDTAQAHDSKVGETRR